MTTRYKVNIIPNGTRLSPINLIGVDILVIGNPGINATFNQTEIDAIVTFVLRGGSLLLMSEGYDEEGYPLNQSMPNTRELNKILRAISLSFVEFTNDTIRDESEFLYYQIGNRHQIPLTSSSFSLETTIGMGIDLVLLFASNININPLFFSSNIFGIGRIIDFDNFIYPLSRTDSGVFYPVWLAGFELFTNSRVLLCGSTMMFSDVSPRGIDLRGWNASFPWYFAHDTSDYGLLFGLPSFNNARLWMNMFDWLSTSENKSFLPLIISFLASIIGLFGVAVSLLIYAKKMKIKEIKIEISEKEKEILPIVLERAETLKAARQSLKDGMTLKAIESYQKASKLSSKIKEERFQKKFSQKARDLRQLVRKK